MQQQYIDGSNCIVFYGFCSLFFSPLHMCGVIGDNIMMYVFVIGEKRISNSNIYAL